MHRRFPVVKTDLEKIDNDILEKASEVLKKGGLVAFPTETVYGLGAHALDERAVTKLFEVKKRDLSDPIIVHISDLKQLDELVRKVPSVAKRLADAFWPGPLTLIFKRKETIPDILTAGLDTVAVRMPSGILIRKLIKESRIPIAAPSANMFGRISPVCAKDVLDEFQAGIDMLIDGGPAEIGVESTVCDVTSSKVKILRPGGVDIEQIESIIGSDVFLEKDKELLKRSPGSVQRHYSPECDLVIVEMGPDQIERVKDLFTSFADKGFSPGILAVREHAESFPSDSVRVLGSLNNAKECARNLYKRLREFDKSDHDVIIAEAVNTKGLGLAVMNRLKKASGGSSGKHPI